MQRTLGLTAPAPDEFTVVPRRPLIMPGDKTLPVPSEGARSLVDVNPQADAIAALSGAGQTVDATGPSEGELALLSAAGAKKAEDPKLRAAIDAEADAEKKSSGKYLFDSWIGDSKIDKKFAIDPRAEAERLRKETDAAVPVPPPVGKLDKSFNTF